MKKCRSPRLAGILFMSGILTIWGVLSSRAYARLARADSLGEESRRADLPPVELHWMDTQGNLLELKWKSRLRWVWRKENSGGGTLGWEPWLQIGVTIPSPLSLVEAEDPVEEASLEDSRRASVWSDEADVLPESDGGRLVIESQAPEVTRKVRIEDLDGQVSEGGVAIRAHFSSPALLVHPSCLQLGLRIAPVANQKGSQTPPNFLFFGASCARRPEGTIDVHWFTSSDAVLVGSPAYSRLKPPSANGGNELDRTWVVSVGERRFVSADPGVTPVPVLAYEVQWTPIRRRAQSPPAPMAAAPSLPSFLGQPILLAPPAEVSLDPWAWLPALMISSGRGQLSLALRARQKTTWGEVSVHLPLVSLSPGAFPAQDIYQLHVGVRILKNFPLFFAAQAQYSRLDAIPEVEGFQFGPKLVAAIEKPASRWAGRLSLASVYGVGGATLNFGGALRFTVGSLPLVDRRLDLIGAVDAWLYCLNQSQSLSWIRPSLGVKVWF